MANTLKQTVTQISQTSLPKRVIVQYFDDVVNEEKQTIINYIDLTEGEKVTFDTYQTLCESKMV